jgi:lysozyme family protein
MEKLFEHEGGFSNHPDDPGGETKWGITKKTFLKSGCSEASWDMLTKEYAAKWYADNFWFYNEVKNERIANALFNLGVNMGTKRAEKYMQRAYNLAVPERLRIAEDGYIGPISRRMINLYKHPAALMMLFKHQAAGHYLRQNKKVFLGGWLNRLDSL